MVYKETAISLLVAQQYANSLLLLLDPRGTGREDVAQLREHVDPGDWGSSLEIKDYRGAR